MKEAERQEAKMSRQERRVEARKAQIIEAATRVFARKGYERATTREIAAEADVSEGIIFYYFAGKRDLLVNIMDQLIVDSAMMEEVFAQADMSDLRAFLVDIFRQRLKMMERNRELMQAIFTAIYQDVELQQQFFKEIMLPFISRIETLIRPYSRAGIMRSLNPVVVIRAIMSVFLAFNFLVLTGLDEKLAAIPHDELAEQWADFFLYGLLARQGEGR
jgi:AcrR family transcriptional regulator